MKGLRNDPLHEVGGGHFRAWHYLAIVSQGIPARVGDVVKRAIHPHSVRWLAESCGSSLDYLLGDDMALVERECNHPLRVGAVLKSDELLAHPVQAIDAGQCKAPRGMQPLDMP